jgi:hypothetical protein
MFHDNFVCYVAGEGGNRHAQYGCVRSAKVAQPVICTHPDNSHDSGRGVGDRDVTPSSAGLITNKHPLDLSMPVCSGM